MMTSKAPEAIVMSVSAADGTELYPEVDPVPGPTQLSRRRSSQEAARLAQELGLKRRLELEHLLTDLSLLPPNEEEQQTHGEASDQHTPDSPADAEPVLGTQPQTEEATDAGTDSSIPGVADKPKDTGTDSSIPGVADKPKDTGTAQGTA